MFSRSVSLPIGFNHSRCCSNLPMYDRWLPVSNKIRAGADFDPLDTLARAVCNRTLPLVVWVMVVIVGCSLTSAHLILNFPAPSLSSPVTMKDPTVGTVLGLDLLVFSFTFERAISLISRASISDLMVLSKSIRHHQLLCVLLAT